MLTAAKERYMSHGQCMHDLETVLLSNQIGKGGEQCKWSAVGNTDQPEASAIFPAGPTTKGGTGVQRVKGTSMLPTPHPWCHMSCLV